MILANSTNNINKIKKDNLSFSFKSISDKNSLNKRKSNLNEVNYFSYISIVIY
jgi:hypothetical protein